jgi:hypothetical protein
MGDKRKPPNEPPPPELIAAAKRGMQEDLRGLDQLAADFRTQFGASTPLDYFTIMPQGDVPFRAYIFFKRQADVAACEASGVSEAMRVFVRQRLIEIGRSGEAAFEFDSREHAGPGGSYFLRLR